MILLCRNPILCWNPMVIFHSFSQLTSQQHLAVMITLSFLQYVFPWLLEYHRFLLLFSSFETTHFHSLQSHLLQHTLKITVRVHRDLFLKWSSFSLYILFPGILIYSREINYYLYHQIYLFPSLQFSSFYLSSHLFTQEFCLDKWNEYRFSYEGIRIMISGSIFVNYFIVFIW